MEQLFYYIMVYCANDLLGLAQYAMQPMQLATLECWHAGCTDSQISPKLLKGDVSDPYESKNSSLG